MDDDKNQLSKQLNQSLENISKEIETILFDLETIESGLNNSELSKILNNTKKKIKAILLNEEE
tara:strand:- start:79 stop:267 length:189 start_codon:yes stop_codon:yes gene_type:complete